MRAVILAGLGNPGASYAGNRHNIGFMAVEQLAQDHGFRSWSAKFGGMLAEGRIGDVKAYAFKPMGYMNTSGVPLSQLAAFYKIPPEDVYVIHDELDLLPARLRVKAGGGNGGHNGLKSIDAHLGPDYHRLRIGIGHPGHKDMVSSYVLSDFFKDEKPLMATMLQEISRHLPLLLAGDEAGFMNKITLAFKES